MKDFLKYVGATIVGLILFGFVMAAFGIMSIIGIIASAEATQKVKENSVLVLNLDGVMQEQADQNFMAELQGDTGLGLSETLTAIRKAKNNENIKGIYLSSGAIGADMAQLEEVRNALADFRKTGKWIIAYGEVYSQAGYYLASVADKIYMNPRGAVEWRGLGGNPVFLKDVYNKIGLKILPFKCGKYKSATETYTEDRMSEASRAQTERYVNGWWQTICRAVSKSRGISVDTLNAYADRLVSMEDPKNMVKYKMVDGLLYNDQVKDVVKKMLKLEKDDTINQISIDGMAGVPEDADGDEIAVYYAYGTIVDEANPRSIVQSGHLIVGKDVCKDLAALAEDDNVKAVVIRVNSGGGSAYASEQIWHQVELLKAKKPVVVSMGGAAASGGYYMSAGANYIYAEPSTITGSIGIYGLMLDRSELMTQKLGFRYDEVKTNRNATMGNEIAPVTAEQQGYMQAAIDRGYMLFKSRVAQGRRMTMDKVEANAQGHVFLGSDALKLGLIDGLGGLDKAVAKAAELAKVKKYYTAGYPGASSFFDTLLESTSESTDDILNGQLRTVLGDFYEPFVLMQSAKGQAGIQARMPFIIKLK